MSKPYIRNIAQSNFVISEPTSYYEGNVAIPLTDLTSFQKMRIVKSGITKTYLVHLKKEFDLDYDALAYALSVTRSTLINKKSAQKFSYQISDRIIGLADLYSFGYEVFDDKEKFNRWMFVSNQSLGGVKPFDFVDNFYGRQEIHNLIGRIAHGVFS